MSDRPRTWLIYRKQNSPVRAVLAKEEAVVGVRNGPDTDWVKVVEASVLERLQEAAQAVLNAQLSSNMQDHIDAIERLRSALGLPDEEGER